jgi:hypothetical protein
MGGWLGRGIRLLTIRGRCRKFRMCNLLLELLVASLCFHHVMLLGCCHHHLIRIFSAFISP